MVNPYLDYVSHLARLLRDGARLPLGSLPPLPRPPVAGDAACVLIFSPHPDDECIIGGLPLRLQREAGMRIVNVAVTQGSRKERRGPRWEELRAACTFLGWDLVGTRPGGLERINRDARERDPAHWRRSVDVIAEILEQRDPAVVFAPHDADWNSTHIGTHHLVMDALARQPAGFACAVVETEFWGAMTSPNLMVESDAEDVADLMAALSFHAGEVRRNPYHLRLPAWLIDNVRRGGEVVGGQGGAAPDFTFATLYRMRRWAGGALRTGFDGGRVVAADTNAGEAMRD